MVAVYVPIGVVEMSGALSVYKHFARRVFVQTSDYVEQRGFAAARRSQHGYEFVFSECEVDAAQSRHGGIGYLVILCYVF